MPANLVKLLPFLQWGREINQAMFGKDLLAGITGAVIALPQGVAYALIAGLPAEYGLYSAIVVCILASLFGSSHHMVSGPTAALSIVLMSVISPLANGAEDYIQQAVTLTLMVGVIQLAMGALRLGSLVNFISHTVVIGFTAGAAVLIAASQLQHLLGVEIASGLSLVDELQAIALQIPNTHGLSLAVGAVSLIISVIARRISRKLPHLLLGLGAASLLSWAIDGPQRGVALVGALPSELPSFATPQFSAGAVKTLSSGALAIAMLGLIEAVSIARAISLRSGQRINGNQEFVGQGLSNFVGAFFGCFVGSGSFTRSGANYDAGAQTPLAAIFSSLLLALIVVFIPDVTAYLPMPAIAGSIMLIAWNLFDFKHIKEILRANYNEVAVLAATFLSTLFIELEFAIYVGVMLSLVLYLRRTSRPRVLELTAQEASFHQQLNQIGLKQSDWCPQIKLIRVDGSLFFGSADHVQRRLRELTSSGNTLVLMIGSGINFIDLAGAQMLEQEAQRLESAGGYLAIIALKHAVIDELKDSGYLDKIGEARLFATPQAAIAMLLRVVDKQRCNPCHQKAFAECLR
ncbi:sulfate permease, SulP family [Vibrio xiamenensis]|uniref:Sulfate permease, SulP family n=1 Tax=Vibrio xiamenensis TaxID=861298 RepID=A0A1G7XY11_9VIBR|nr:SulP family inorganic anion transporter [Vibrio xiamenensis]SDG77671.1 sulfate permease, SulP family [Vibrio xiamenensis]SDG89095.1 sulfate permease, SulP family [Vibrio xiamenensis]